MISLRESLEGLVDSSAAEALSEGATPEGRGALARVTLLLAVLERLQNGGDAWLQCGVLPAEISLVAPSTAASFHDRPN